MCLAWATTELLFTLYQQSQQDGGPIQHIFSWRIKVADNWLNILWFFCVLTCSTTLLGGGIFHTVKSCMLQSARAVVTCQADERRVGKIWWWIISAGVSRFTPICSSRRLMCCIETESPSNSGWTVSMSHSSTDKLSARTVVHTTLTRVTE